MSKIKQRALEKMNEEMSEGHSRSIDAIHNWLCDQDDDELFEKVCQDGKSINSAYMYCHNKAADYREGNGAMVSDDIVFGWVVDYFKSSLQEVKETYLYSSKGIDDKKHAEKKETPKNNVKTSRKEKEKSDFERISLFEL
nr:MAG TPA: PcfK-like protein [Caudoviricetes sp.]